MKYDVSVVSESFGPLHSLCVASPSAKEMVCQNGRFYYIGHGGVVQIENDFTASLPDFAIPAEALDTVLSWFTAFWLHEAGADRQGIFVGPTGASLVFTAVCGVGAILAIPLVKASAWYDGIEEAINRPKLTNKYKVKITANDYSKLISSILIAADSGDTYFELVGAGNSLLISYTNLKGITARTVLPEFDGLDVGKNWRNVYNLSALIDASETNSVVSLGFSDNEKDYLSPLMIGFENGTTLVLLPSWK